MKCLYCRIINGELEFYYKNRNTILDDIKLYRFNKMTKGVYNDYDMKGGINKYG